MATIQLSRVLATKPTTRTVVHQQQSLETVQAMLHGALSSIAFSRFFFREKAFDRQTYKPEGDVLSYSDYLAGDSILSGTRVPVLKPNRSKRADVFLSWLENGVYDVLKDGNLKSLQVFVHPDEDDTHRDKVIETYTFSFTYRKGPDGVRVPGGLEVAGDAKSSMSVDLNTSPRVALLGSLLKIQTDCAKLPLLPAKRSISVRLVFDELDPWSRDGWVPGNLDEKLFAQATGWERQTKRFNELDSGFHSTVFEIDHLQSQANLPRFDSQSSPRRKFPKSFECTEPFSKIALDRKPRLNAIPDASDIRVIEESPAAAASTPSTVLESSPVKGDCRAAEGKSDLKTSVAPGLAPDTSHVGDRAKTILNADPLRTSSRTLNGDPVDPLYYDTQASNAQEMRSALQAMMQPENLTQGETQTQAFETYHRSINDDFSNSKLGTDLPPGAEPAHLGINHRPELSQVVVRRLEKERNQLVQAARKRCNISGRKSSRKQVVFCQCGHNEKHGTMIACDYCGTWQHAICYGYQGNDNNRLPEIHACYHCLLEDRDDETLKKLCDLAQMRRGVDVIAEKGLQDKRQFSNLTGFELMNAGLVESQLRVHGYLVPDSKRKMRPSYSVVKHGANYEKMQKDLFDPMRYISHHYGVPTSAAASQNGPPERDLASQAESMGPPATPASRVNKRQRAIAPVAGQDSPVTPFRTPVRNSSRAAQQGPSIGRDGDEEQSASKRQRTLGPNVELHRSVQTAIVVNADGLSSSPVPR